MIVLLFGLIFAIMLIYLLSLFMWLSLKGVGRDRKFLDVLLVNIIAVVFCGIIYWVMSLVPTYAMFAPIATGLIYIILIRSVLSIRLWETLLVIFFSAFASSLVLFGVAHLTKIEVFEVWAYQLLRLEIAADLIEYLVKNYHLIVEQFGRLISR